MYSGGFMRWYSKEMKKMEFVDKIINEMFENKGDTMKDYEEINGIKHYTWATGYILNNQNAVIYYKDFGDSVLVTDWNNIPNVKELEKKLNPVQFKHFKWEYAYQEKNKILFRPCSFSNRKIETQKGSYLDKYYFEIMLKQIKYGLEYIEKYSKEPQLKYAIIEVEK